jgi:hypothetical protein
MGVLGQGDFQWYSFSITASSKELQARPGTVGGPRQVRSFEQDPLLEIVLML